MAYKLGSSDLLPQRMSLDAQKKGKDEPSSVEPRSGFPLVGIAIENKLMVSVNIHYFICMRIQKVNSEKMKWNEPRKLQLLQFLMWCNETTIIFPTERDSLYLFPIFVNCSNAAKCISFYSDDECNQLKPWEARNESSVLLLVLLCFILERNWDCICCMRMRWSAYSLTLMHMKLNEFVRCWSLAVGRSVVPSVRFSYCCIASYEGNGRGMT